jgi:hypothetical protein
MELETLLTCDIHLYSFPRSGVIDSKLGTLRDRPINLKGGLWFFVLFRNFFSDNTRVIIFIFFLSREAQFFFPEFNIRLYDKNSESDYYFFPPPKSEYFFQQHWESEYFFKKKKTITSPSSQMVVA